MRSSRRWSKLRGELAAWASARDPISLFVSLFVSLLCATWREGVKWDKKTRRKVRQQVRGPLKNHSIRRSRVDYGGWAEHYASRPYANFKFEVYPLFVDILACLPDRSRVLDIGAGPGHLAFEFLKAHPKSTAYFTLLDSCTKLLEIAASRLTAHESQVRTRHRSFRAEDWDVGLGKFDALVSNNVPFPVRPEELLTFYRKCLARLKKNGVFLFQEPCAYSDGCHPYGGDPLSDFMAALPTSILPSSPPMSRREQKKLEAEKREAIARQQEAIVKAEAAGVVFPKEEGWQFVTVEEHLRCLREAGFSPGCIWKKRGAAVFLGVKGKPKLRSAT